MANDLPDLPTPLASLARPWAWLAGRPTWARWLRGLVIVWVGLSVVFAEIDRQLGQMHLGGARSFTTSDLTPKVAPFGLSPQRLDEILHTWRSWQLAHPGPHGPADLLRAHVGFDLAFPVVTAAILGIFAYRIWVSAPEDSVERQISALALITPLLYLVADYVENLAMSRAVFDLVPIQSRLTVAALVITVTLVVVLIVRPHDVGKAARWKAVVLVGISAVAIVAAVVGGRVVSAAACLGQCRGDLRPANGVDSRLLLASTVKWALLGATVLALVVAAIDPIRHWLGDKGIQRWLRAVLGVRGQVVAVLPVVALPLLPRLSADLGLQVQDIFIRTLVDGDRSAALVHPLLFVAAPLVLMVVLAAFGARAIEVGETDPPPALPEKAPAIRRWLVAAGVSLVVAGFGIVFRSASWAPAVIALAGLVFVVAVLSLPSEVRALRATKAVLPKGHVARAALAGIVVAVPFALAQVAVRAAFTLWQAGASGPDVAVAAASSVALFGAAVAASSAPRAIDALTEGPTRRWVLGLATVAAAVLTVVAEGRPVEFGERLGSYLVLVVASGVLAVVFGWIVVASSEVPARGALALARFRRLPAITAIVVVALLAGTQDSNSGYHDVHRIAGATTTAAAPVAATTSGAGTAAPLATARRGLSLDAAFDSWVGQHPETGPAPAATGDHSAATDLSRRRPIPLVFVSTAGGGIKAAYWTSVVLNCLDAPSDTGSSSCPRGSAIPRSNLFLASGISGGSVGLAMDQARHPDGGAATFGLESLLGTTLGRDGVGPVLTGMFWRDLPNSLVRVGRWDDRATLLEQAWVDAFADAGGAAHGGLTQGLWASATSVDATGRTQAHFPLMIMNGASIDDHCRIAGSVLDLAPDTTTSTGSCTATDLGTAGGDGRVLARTRDLGDYVCSDKDVTLATAGLLSARFPLVSPFGILRPCAAAAGAAPGGGAPRTPAPTAFDVDGGLVESSGAGPVPEILHALAAAIAAYDRSPTRPGTCIAPRLIMVDNNYDLPVKASPGSNPNGLASPLGFRAADSAASPAAQQAAALAFEAALPANGCGADQPSVAKINLQGHPGLRAPLGWTLSNETSTEMLDQIGQTPARCGLVLVRSWFQAPVGATGGGDGDACVDSARPVAVEADGAVRAADADHPAATQVYWQWNEHPRQGSPRYERTYPVVEDSGEVEIAASPSADHPMQVCLEPPRAGGTDRLGQTTSAEATLPPPDRGVAYLALPLRPGEHLTVDLLDPYRRVMACQSA